MNERIQELLVEAHRQTKGGIYDGHLSEWSEKFAELIVRECAHVGYDASYYECASHVSNKIKEHFGVE